MTLNPTKGDPLKVAKLWKLHGQELGITCRPWHPDYAGGQLRALAILSSSVQCEICVQLLRHKVVQLCTVEMLDHFSFKLVLS